MVSTGIQSANQRNISTSPPQENRTPISVCVYLEELTLRNVMQAINRKACIDYLHQYHILFLIETWPHYSHEIDATHERAVIAVNIFGKMSNLKKFAHVWENIW